MRTDDGQKNDYELKRRDALAEKLGPAASGETTAETSGAAIGEPAAPALPSAEAPPIAHQQPAAAEAAASARPADYHTARVAELREGSGPPAGAGGVIAAFTAPAKTNGHTSNGNGHNGNGNGHSAAARTAIGRGANGNGNGNGHGNGFNGRYGYWPNGNGHAAHAAAPAPNPYVEFARRWWWAVLAGTAVGGVATLAYLRVTPTPYQSTAQLMLVPDNRWSAARPQVLGQSYAAQAASPAMLDLTARALPTEMGVDTAKLLEMVRDKRIEIRPLRNANLINVTVTDDDPKRARTLADTITTAFSGYVNAAAGGNIESRKRALAERIEQARQQVATAELFQTEGTLRKDLDSSRSQFLQLQLTYQQGLQRQAAGERLQRADGTGGASTDAWAVVQEMEAHRQEMRLQIVGSAQSQEQQLQQKVSETEAELASVRQEVDALAQQLGAAAPEVIARLQAERELRRREGELSRSLLEQQSRLLQTRRSYQQELERQFQAERTLASPDPEARQRLSELSGASAQAQAETLQVVRNQQRDAEQRIADLEKQREDVRAAMPRLPAVQPTSGTTSTSWYESQRQRTRDLQDREQELGRAIRDERNRLDRLQLQYRQELQRSGGSEKEPVASGSTVSPQDPERAADAVRARAESLQILASQQAELERSVADFSRQLAAVRASLPSPVGDVKVAESALAAIQQERLRELTSQERELTKSLEAQEDRLYNLRNGIRNQLEAEIVDQLRVVRSDARAELLGARAGAQGRGGAQLPEDVVAESLEARTESLDLVGTLLHEQRMHMADTSDRLAEVRTAIAALPAEVDPILSTAVAEAYRAQLKKLTGEHAELELNTDRSSVPVQKFGAATPPVPVTTAQRKLLGTGGVASLGAGVALAGLLELLRRRRQVAAAGAGAPSRQLSSRAEVAGRV